MESGINSKTALGQLFIGYMRVLAGESPKEVAKQTLRSTLCPWCAEGWPIDENGQHDVFGIKVDCEVGHQYRE